MTDLEKADRRNSTWAIVAAASWVLTYFGARVTLKTTTLKTGFRVAVVLFPIVPFIAMLWLLIRGIRGMDELERRIQLEALAVAFPLTFLMVMTLGLLELAVKLKPEDWSYRHVWPFMFVFYLFGLILAKRRYQ